MIIYVANFINKSSNINGSFGSNKSFLGRLIKGGKIMVLLAIEIGSIVVGKVVVKEIKKLWE